ncbi:GNAT family N-acetyltransferase [Aquihabitans sp. McL0605]|uniref:GNAT family N-acetyltransferase n=1 Tax=Aquihabitans sp. McL0605 TaxID=3415671 RepID=UPI003CEDF42F
MPSEIEDITAAGLRLVAVPAEVLRRVGEAQDARAGGDDAGAPVPWPAVGDLSPELWTGMPARMRLDQLADDPALARWLVRAIVIDDPDRPGTPLVVGHLGGHGAPGDDGSVEIGYTVAAAHQGRGLATAAARAWFGWAHQQGADRARLCTRPDNGPSKAIAARLGFDEVGAAWDDDDACWELVFERPLPL